MKNEMKRLRSQVEDLEAEVIRLQAELKAPNQKKIIFHEKDTHLDSETLLRESEERLRIANEAARIGTYMTNLEADKVYWSPELCDILGVPPGTVRTNEEAYKVVHEDDIERVLAIGRCGLDPNGDGCFCSEHRVVRPDGQVRWILWRGRTIFRETKSGKIPSKRIGACVDITERKQAEDALRESEARFRVVVESAPDAIFVESAGRFAYLNSAACRLFGASKQEDLLGKDFLQWVAPEYRDKIQGRIRLQRTDGEPAALMEQEYLRLDGLQVPVETTAVSIRYQGEDSHIVFVRDITARKQALAYREIGQEILQILNEPGDLKESIQRVIAVLKTRTGFDAVGIRLQNGNDFPYCAQQGFSKDFLLTENTLIERAADGRACRDKDGNLNLECTCGLVISGKTDPTHPLFSPGGSFWTNDSFSLLDIPPDQEPRLNPRNQCIHQGYASVALVPIRNKDRIVGLIQLNDRRKGRFTLAAVEILEGIASHIAAALMRKRAEEALRESEAIFSSFMEHSPVYVFFKDEATRSIRLSRNYEQMLGRPIEDLLGKTVEELFPPELAKGMIKDDLNVIRGGKPIKVVEELSGRTFETTKFPILQPGKPPFLAGFTIDITERKREDKKRDELEVQLRQAQKMEAIGTLAGGIAHDFNNILSVIIGNTEILEMTDISFSGKNELTQILTASQRAKQLVRQILTFSRQGEQQKLLISLKPVLKETLEFLRASLPSTIHLQHSIKPDVGAIMADPVQMQQVLMNLCTNAAHAMEKNGGVLKIDLDTVTVAEEETQIEPDVEHGEYLRLTVSDTGHGIDPRFLQRIFDPYFTTKGPDKGTGLGLSVVHGIVKSHGGIIKVYSEVGKGTVFHILIPRADGAEKKEEKATQQLPIGVERILVVDDEKNLVEMYQRMLGLLGYQVETRTSPIEALEAVRMNPQKYDLVISDMTMPQMTGYNLAKKFMEIRPGLPVILCTGFSDQINAEKARSVGILAFLLKPVLLHDLANTLRKVLDEIHKKKAG